MLRRPPAASVYTPYAAGEATMGATVGPGRVPGGRLRRWSFVLGAAALYATLGYAAWHWAALLFPSR